MLASTLVVVSWAPYTGPSVLYLSSLLLLISAGLALFSRRKVNKDIRLPRMGRVTGIVVAIVWAFSILTFLKINRDLARYTGSAGNLGPIFPITVGSAICTFIYVAYLCRHEGALSALSNGFLAFIGGPMIFEFPFLMIVIPRVRAPPVTALIFLVPLFTIIITTLSLLLLSRNVALTRRSLYFFSAMIFTFAIWALDGYSYPSNPTSFTLNAIAKMLGFACIATLFQPKTRLAAIETGEPEDIDLKKNQARLQIHPLPGEM